jgi:hypothetical protein
VTAVAAAHAPMAQRVTHLAEELLGRIDASSDFVGFTIVLHSRRYVTSLCDTFCYATHCTMRHIAVRHLGLCITLLCNILLCDTLLCDSYQHVSDRTVLFESTTNIHVNPGVPFLPRTQQTQERLLSLIGPGTTTDSELSYLRDRALNIMSPGLVYNVVDYTRRRWTQCSRPGWTAELAHIHAHSLYIGTELCKAS